MGGLNERIKKPGMDLHLTQENGAKHLGVGRTVVVEIESGKRRVSAGGLEKLSELFLASADELLHGRGVSSPSQVFAHSFEELDESDQREILNLIEFKRAMKSRG